jgi:hypothetical protein
LCACLAVALLSISCSEPPDKEMQQAQGAIDAARAVGAEEYAHEEFVAAEDALKRAHDAAEERDYRLALNHALDSRERAQTAAREAADRKATLRLSADRTITAAAAAIARADARAKAADAKGGGQRSANLRRGVEHATAQLQEARTAMAAGQYADAERKAKAALAALAPVSTPNESTSAKPPARHKP